MPQAKTVAPSDTSSAIKRTPAQFSMDLANFFTEGGTDTDEFFRWYFSVEDPGKIPDWAAEIAAKSVLKAA